MKKLDYICKFCGVPGQAEYDDTCPLNLDYWRSLLCCNRCADFMHDKERLIDQAKQIGGSFALTRKKKGAEDRAAQVRQAFEAIADEFCQVVSDYLKTPDFGAKELIQVLMERPDCAGPTLESHFRRLRSRRARSATSGAARQENASW